MSLATPPLLPNKVFALGSPSRVLCLLTPLLTAGVSLGSDVVSLGSDVVSGLSIVKLSSARLRGLNFFPEVLHPACTTPPRVLEPTGFVFNTLLSLGLVVSLELGYCSASLPVVAVLGVADDVRC